MNHDSIGKMIKWNSNYCTTGKPREWSNDIHFEWYNCKIDNQSIIRHVEMAFQLTYSLRGLLNEAIAIINPQNFMPMEKFIIDKNKYGKRGVIYT